MNDEFLRALPKVQLHCHLEGTVREETFLELARDAELDIPKHPYAFATFAEFLLAFQAICRTLTEPESYARIAREYTQDAAAQGVRYAEIFISPSVWSFFHPAIDRRACVSAIRDALDASKDRIEVALICDLTRNFGPESAVRTAREAAEWQGLGVIAIGLGGDETRFPAGLFTEAYELARDEGLRTVAHAGEVAGAESVRDAVELLGAERIGHGIRAVEDPAVVALLIERGIALEVCPTSNRLTGAWPPEQAHPVEALDAAGVTIAIDADDPAMFGASLLDEYRLVEGALGTEAILRFARNAIAASFAQRETKARLFCAFEEAVGVARS